MEKKLFYVGFLIIFIFVLIIFISVFIQQKIPLQDNYEIFTNRDKMLDFFNNYKSEKFEQFTPSATIVIEPKKTCESEDDCLLVSNYFKRLKVNCKIDPDAPGDWMLCPSQNGSANFLQGNQSTEQSQGYLPKVGDPRYQWGDDWYTDCLNPMNLNESEIDDLEIENSITRKCSCLTLSEYYQGHSIEVEDNESDGGKNETFPGGEQVPPPTPTGENDTAEPSDIDVPTSKYCLLLRKTADLIVSDIDIPDYPLETGIYSFDTTIKNLGPDKCCEAIQVTEFLKDGNYLAGSGLHMTFECWAFPDGDGILPNQSIISGTGVFDFSEVGNYTIKSDVVCLVPEEGNIDNGLFEVDIQIE